MAKKDAVDLGMKLGEVYVLLGKQPKASPEMKVFMIVDKASPHDLSLDDLCEITKLDRSILGPAVAVVTNWGYIQERGGLLSRPR